MDLHVLDYYVHVSLLGLAALALTAVVVFGAAIAIARRVVRRR